MAETARASNGKFVKRIADEPNNATGTDGGEFQPANAGFTSIDPSKISGTGEGSGTGETGTSEGKRPRGRPVGFSPKRAKEETPLHIDGISGILLSTHAMLAAMAHVPELALTEDESKRMASAAAKVAEHYDIAKFSPKQQAWFSLIICTGTIYGSKYFAYSARTKAEAKHKARQKEVAKAMETVKPENNGLPDISNLQ